MRKSAWWRVAEGQTTSDVIIAGGGLHGCSAALQLSMRGARVTVVEKDYPGRHASGVNAGGVRRLGRALPEIPLSLRAMEMWHDIETLVTMAVASSPKGRSRLPKAMRTWKPAAPGVKPSLRKALRMKR